MNGAELIAQIDRMTMGWWRPSPGSIYPLLEQLEEEKLVQKNADGRYQLTEAAKSGPDWMQGFLSGMSGPRNPEDAVRELEAYATYLEDVARSDRDRVRGVGDRLHAVARRLDSLIPAGAARDGK
jgi:DNA-binding PadR family transcriptional regulator